MIVFWPLEQYEYRNISMVWMSCLRTRQPEALLALKLREEKTVLVDKELLIAHKELMARRKLTRILCSHSLKHSDFELGDSVQVNVRHNIVKRSKWISPRKVILICIDAERLTVLGHSGKPSTQSLKTYELCF